MNETMYQQRELLWDNDGHSIVADVISYNPSGSLRTLALTGLRFEHYIQIYLGVKYVQINKD